MIFSTAYFPPVLYFKEIFNSKNIIIEVNDNYQKQTYRNRTNILSANGVLPLSFPVVKSHNTKTKTKDIRIDYSTNWQKNHYRAILSAYKMSPFFDYYIDYFIRFFEKKYNFLIEYNTLILQELLNIYDLDKKINYTNDYFREYKDDIDLRDVFLPKSKHSAEEKCKKYKQVFDSKFNFIPNLSILDMLFNLGPESEIYLTEDILR